MSNSKFDWQILRRAKRSDYLGIVAWCVALLIILALNLVFIFRLTANQTEQLGQMQLDQIRGELQEILSNADRTILRVAASAEQMLAAGASQAEIRAFFEREQQQQMISSQGECFNVYIAQRDWAIIPNFNMPADYHAHERNWYKGAAENPGRIHITEPYIDAAGNGLCFTVSLMLSDKTTVVALDFNFSAAQNTISKMDTGKNRTALIVARNGTIIGCSDKNFIGEKLSKKLPEYQNVFAAVLNAQDSKSFESSINGRTNTIFSSTTDNGWYMILCVDTSELYKDDYRHILMNTAVNLLMILIIVFYYLKSMMNRLETEKALQIKDEFLSNLSGELRAPLQKILHLSNVGALGGEEHPTENAARVRESALQLSEMIDNLLSFSTLVKSGKDDATSEQRADKSLKLSKFSRTARLRIIAVLTIALLLRLGINVDTSLGWGDTKMTREVETYERRLSDWMIEQKTIMSMFVNVIGEHPEILDDYQGAVKFLNDIAIKYPDISVCYLANPYKEHRVIMNNGWEPPPEFSPETRPWYTATRESPEGFCISAPYYDVQTGLYCLTISQIVYDKDNKFIGIFCIDFYIDRLIQILASNYSADSYAFLVDSNGVIINHPNPAYQMDDDHTIRITDTEYRYVYAHGQDFLMQDYRGAYMTCTAKKNPTSNFTVVVADNWNKIYGQVVLYATLFIAIYLVCVWLVVGLVDKLLKWQTEVQSKLKAAAKSALNAGQAKSQFLAQMSHEIRTPINAVLGMNEIILRESKEPDTLEYAQNIASASRTLLNLINSILDFSKIEEGKMEIIPARYETVAMIDDLVNMIYDRANKKNLSLITKIDSNLPRVLFGDEIRIKQVITNILTNAVKYTKEGTVTLTMRGEVLGNDEFELFVSVADTGIGIRAEDMGKLFQSFQRIDEERNRNIEGTGLGISIVTELLRMMNSKLDVQSEYGRGSDFSFKLRQKIIDATPIGNYSEHHSERQSQRVEAPCVKAPSAKILAVDDTAMNLKVIRGLLKRNKIVPDLADSGAKCLELAAKNTYDIIFLDHMMPEMDGVETLRELKKIPLPETTKIVVLTANAISGARERYLAKGFDDYLSKPISVNALESILTRYLPQTAIRNDDTPQQPDTAANNPQVQVSNSSLIDKSVALANCMDSEEFFVEMAEEFVAGDKTADLDAALSAGDLNSYKITIHALKSTALVVGAVSLSESAKLQEAAAKAERLDEVNEKHAPLMELYAKVRAELSTIVNQNSN